MTHVPGPDRLAPNPAEQSAVRHGGLVPTVFHEPWWLDIVSFGRWEAAEVTENGRVIGRMPYLPGRRLGQRTLGMPLLTHFLGPAIDEGTGSHQARWLRQIAVTRDLIGRLPSRASLWQKFHRGVADVVAFQAERFETGVQFTFEVEPAPQNVLWAALRDKHRNVIRKAGQRYVVEELTDSAEFARLYERNLQDRGRPGWAPATMMAELLAAATGRGAGRMLGLRGADRNLVAAIFCPSDSRASYYTLSTRRPDSGNGAVPLLVWDAIRRAARSGRVFDFDGLSSENSIGLYAGFGGVTRPRYIVSRLPSSRLVRLLRRGLGVRASAFGG